MTTVLAMAGVTLRRLARDRLALFFVVLLPVVIILVIGITVADSGSDRLPVGVLDLGAGPLGAELQADLATSPALEPRAYDDLDGLRKAVRRGVVAAGVVLPAGYDQALRAGRDAEVTFVVDQTRSAPAAVRSAVAAAITRQAAIVQAARFAAGSAGVSFDAALARARTLGGEQEQVRVEATTIGGREDALPSGFNYTAPSNLVLFVFITSLAGAAALIEERRLGVTSRMLAAPTTASTILLGETLGRFLVALLQGLIVFVVGWLVFGVDWGDPPAALLLVVVFAMVGTGAGMLFGTVLRTAEQATSIGPPVGIALGMLGGCMWPLAIVPEPMRVVGHLFPHAWAMDAFIDLISEDAGLAGIAGKLAVLAGFAAVLLAVATWRLHRALVR
ncbi:MAG TPA: ABC transporter permease [Actinomycetota bacterium]|nr:ABC transporter permease [Actinomycetota bacterium]